jgi:hypothetical protein
VEAAPYDRIMVTAATTDLEPAWLEQLAAGGLLSAPLSLAPGLAFVVRGTVDSGTFDGGLVRAAFFMPLRSEGESGAGGDIFSAEGGLSARPAPWGDWFARRRSRSGWLRFSQSLAFYGWLHGLDVHFREAHGGEFAVSRAGSLCWFGLTDWQAAGGFDLGQWLWREFLEAGGPWPTEFQLRARPGTGPSLPDGRAAFIRSGPRCQLHWHLPEQRERRSAPF